MPMAILFPSPTLSMIRRGPKTQSPPAKDAGRRGGERPAVRDDQSARAYLDAIIGRQKIQLGGLSDGQDHRVAFDHGFAVVVESRVEPAPRSRTPTWS